ncbi:MAG: hypothetical protein MI921_13385 [Cytophagales bacterium]|nr:hypothetical protein [Cytophagales bacterium]
MKNTLKILLLLAVIVMTSTVKAQTGSRLTEEEKAEARARYETYQERLNLTEKQSEKVEEINMIYFEGLSELRKSNKTRLVKYREWKKLSKTRDKEMKTVLNDQQYEAYKEFQAEMKEDFKAKRKNGNG